jgi:putative transposase
VDHELEALVFRMAKENVGWGYDRIVGASANLGYPLSDQTVGNILRRNGIVPAPERKHTTTWKDFIRAHLEVLARTDFFTVEVLTLRGLVNFYVLFFMHLETRNVDVAGITTHPNERWMKQTARNVTMHEWGLCREMGQIGQGRVSVKADFIRGGLIETGPTRIRGALPRRAKSSGQEQCAVVSFHPRA